MPENSESTGGGRTVLIVLSAALLAWGAYHAIGSYFGGFGGGNLQPDFRRSLMVFASMAIFLGFWWTLMLMRGAKNSRTEVPPATKKEGPHSPGPG